MQMTARFRRNERGVAMLLALMALLLVAGIATMMFARTLNEVRHSGDDTAIVQTLMLARGGANIGSGLLTLDIQDIFSTIVEGTATPGRWAYGDDTAGFSDEGPVPSSVERDLKPAVAILQSEVDSLLCGRNVIQDGSMGEVSLRIFFTDTSCGTDSLPASVTLPSPRFVSGAPRVGDSGRQTYAIPFVLVSEATLNDYRRNILLQGEYRFEVGKSSFSHYAYFTNRDSSTSSQIWFTENTMIDGPVHTNGHFAFYQDPWFGGRVTSVGCTNFGQGTCRSSVTAGAFFYDRQSTLRRVHQMLPNSNRPVFGAHAPVFDDSVSWNAQFVPLPQNAYDQRDVALGLHGEQLTQGIYLDHELDSLDIWAADAQGVSPVYDTNQERWIPPATHQYVRACREGREWQQTADGYWERYWAGWGGGWQYRWVDEPQFGWVDVEICDTYRYADDDRLYKLTEDSDFADPDSWEWELEPKPFNGVIYVSGDIERFRGPERTDAADGESAPPAVARFAQLTVVAEDDIRLTRDLRYEQPPCTGVPTRLPNRSVERADCTNLNHPNVLGVYTPGGDVIIGNDHQGEGSEDLNAPPNMHVHAVLMSSHNQIRVEGYVERGSYRADRGQFFLMGGMIQENRGVFGTFGGAGRRGYDRVYTYDPRMLRGITPPYFPTTGLDEVTAVRHFSFGQREQVY